MMEGNFMKSLIAEDGFTGRRVLHGILSKFGPCDGFSNGVEALDAFKLVVGQADQQYDLVCLDIMMPFMTGQEVLKEIRKIEKLNGIQSENAVKVIMTTGMANLENVKQAFTQQCEGYLLKPIDHDRLIEKIKELKLI